MGFELFKIDIGSGENPYKEFIHFDVRMGLPHLDCVGDVRRLPFKGVSVTEIYCSHLLEHFILEDVKFVLSEISRILVKGGILYLRVPNFGAIFNSYSFGEWDMEKVNGEIFGGQLHAKDFHYIGFDELYLKKLLCGFGLQVVSNLSQSRHEIYFLVRKND